MKSAQFLSDHKISKESVVDDVQLIYDLIGDGKCGTDGQSVWIAGVEVPNLSTVKKLLEPKPEPPVDIPNLVTKPTDTPPRFITVTTATPATGVTIDYCNCVIDTVMKNITVNLTFYSTADIAANSPICAIDGLTGYAPAVSDMRVPNTYLTSDGGTNGGSWQQWKANTAELYTHPSIYWAAGYYGTVLFTYPIELPPN